MCQIDNREGTVGFAAIRRVLRELFPKKSWGVRSTPLQVRGLNMYFYDVQFCMRLSKLRSDELSNRMAYYRW